MVNWQGISGVTNQHTATCRVNWLPVRKVLYVEPFSVLFQQWPDGQSGKSVFGHWRASCSPLKLRLSVYFTASMITNLVSHTGHFPLIPGTTHNPGSHRGCQTPDTNGPDKVKSRSQRSFYKLKTSDMSDSACENQQMLSSVRPTHTQPLKKNL